MSTQRVAVIGAGVMGHGLAVQFARKNKEVTLIDHRESNLEWARNQIIESVKFLNEEGLTDIGRDQLLGQIRFTLDTSEGVSDADLILESVSEELDIKHEVFANAATAAPDDAILASNTSGIQPTDIAKGISDAADRVIVCHWWNPPYLMPLVEVVPGQETTDSIIERTTAFVESVDRDPIVLELEVPGFIWNRIQLAVIRECMHLLETGVASPEDIDAAVRDGYALRTAVVGPFETMDLAGLDLFETIADNLYPELCDDDEPSDLFNEYRKEDRTGVDVGAGFYEYDEPPERIIGRRNRRIAALRRAIHNK